MIVQIRKANLKDLKEIQKLNLESFKYYLKHDSTFDMKWPRGSKGRKYFKLRIKQGSAFVSLVDGVIIGYLIAGIAEQEDYRKKMKIAELENTFVLKDFRGQGVGWDLMNTFLKWAKLKKANRIRVEASAQNSLAINFYKRNKFKEHNLVLEADLK